jgi:hypothetical protein
MDDDEADRVTGEWIAIDALEDDVGVEHRGGGGDDLDVGADHGADGVGKRADAIADLSEVLGRGGRACVGERAPGEHGDQERAGDDDGRADGLECAGDGTWHGGARCGR